MSTTTLRDGRATLESLVPAGTATTEIAGWWMDEVWDLIRHLSAMLASDITQRVETLDTVSAAEAGGAIIGAYPARVERGASIDPYVVFDTSVGPVLVRRGATIARFSRLRGPAYVGA